MFKFPMLFGRIPKHRRFNYTPRFYDPAKEERDARESRIRMELGADPKDQDADVRTRMSQAFHSRKRNKKGLSVNMKETILQSALVLAMVVLLLSWLEWGNEVFYAFLLLLPVWFYMRFLRKRES